MRSVAGGATRTAAIAAPLAVLLAVSLAACGGSSSNSSDSGARSGANPGYSAPSSDRPDPASPPAGPQVVAPSTAVAPVPPAPAAAPMPAAVAMPLTFTLVPVAGVTGTVRVQPMGDSMFSLTVSAQGFAPSSTHAVHIHFGNCPSAGVHIVALAPITANGGGAGSSTTTVHMAYRGDGRFLIVYAGPNPGPLAACAQLSG